MNPDYLLLTSLLQCCCDIEALEGRRLRLIAKAVEITDDAELNPDFLEAVTRLISGKSGFAVPFGKGESRRLVATVLAPRRAERTIGRSWKNPSPGAGIQRS
jgi:hypothetical protein